MSVLTEAPSVPSFRWENVTAIDDDECEVRYVGGMMIGIRSSRRTQTKTMFCDLCTTCYDRMVSSGLFFDDEPFSEKKNTSHVGIIQ